MEIFTSTTVQVHIASFNEEFDVYKFLTLKRSASEIIYPNLWQVVTGTVEDGETAIQTAIREVFEETGLKPLKIWNIPYIASFFSWRKNTINFAPVFGFLVDSQSQVKLSEEHQCYEWLYLDACLDRLLLPSHKQGTQIFFDVILNSENNSVFEITNSI